MKLLTDWAHTDAPWLTSPGPDQGIACASRLRLARNCAGKRFRRTLDTAEREALTTDILARLGDCLPWSEGLRASMDDLNQSQRLFLVERHLASSELAGGGAQSGIAIRADALASVMIGEEDHVRLQVLSPGLDLFTCLDAAVELDQCLGKALHWAYHPHYGYLTSCPTNLGTGMRASVMLHLPALALSKELPRMLRGLGKLQLTARGFHGEGSEATGHFYQISNQRTLGADELGFIQHLEETIRDIIAYEQEARSALIGQQRALLEDKVYRAWGILRHARRLGSNETIEQCSWLRLGIACGWLEASLWPAADRLLITSQRAHLQLRDPRALDPCTRDVLRADHVRSTLASH
ncbi:MAG: ATP--guanido phosphotransferase [Planctomycetota bacterium]|nr:MAG: ATP--guanido phosphotransferase [Planctomycetota bacterium]